MRNKTFVMLSSGVNIESFSELFRMLVIDHPALYFGDPFRDIVTPARVSYSPIIGSVEQTYESISPLSSGRYLRQGATLSALGVANMSTGFFVRHNVTNQRGFITTVNSQPNLGQKTNEQKVN